MRLINPVQKLLLTAGIFAITFAGCGLFDDEDDVFEDGVHEEIREFIDDETMTIIEDSLAVPVHRGDSPPDLGAILGSGVDNDERQMGPMSQTTAEIEGVTVVMSPFLRIETLVPNDPIDEDGFLDHYIRLRDQDMDEYQINVDMMHRGHPPTTGLGGFIIGDEEEFTIFVEVTQEHDDSDDVISARVFSGRATPEGVEDAFEALLMIDNAERDDLIDDGTGRSFKDGNGIARVTEWPLDDRERIAEDEATGSTATNGAAIIQ